MKKYVLLLAATGVLSLGSCKKETVVEQTTVVNEDGSSTTTTKTTTDYDVMRLRKAEDDYNKAEQDVITARERGDTQAERIAQEASDKAKAAWEEAKKGIRTGAAKTKEAINDVRDDIRNDRDTIVVKTSNK